MTFRDRSSRLFKQVLLLAALGSAGAAAVKAVRRRFAEPVWHTPTHGAGSLGGSQPAAEPPRSAPPAKDAAGAAPDEAASDRIEVPHAVTTPDEPVETVILED